VSRQLCKQFPLAIKEEVKSTEGRALGFLLFLLLHCFCKLLKYNGFNDDCDYCIFISMRG
jgi:hypothetical protein